MTSPKRKMRATTVRFSQELWDMLDHEARASGVSVAQFVRDAALSRVMYAAGRRGDPIFDGAPSVAAGADRDGKLEASRRFAAELRADSRALRSEGAQARMRARQVREQVEGDRPAGDETPVRDD